MSPRISSETIEYERTVDKLRDSNLIMRAMLERARSWINDECERRGKEDEHYESPAKSFVASIDALLTGLDSQATPSITIRVEGGIVQDVTGLPTGYELHVEDHDEGDTSHPSWDEEKRCFVTIFDWENT